MPLRPLAWRASATWMAWGELIAGRTAFWVPLDGGLCLLVEGVKEDDLDPIVAFVDGHGPVASSDLQGEPVQQGRRELSR